MTAYSSKKVSEILHFVQNDKRALCWRSLSFSSFLQKQSFLMPLRLQKDFSHHTTCTTTIYGFNSRYIKDQQLTKAL
jgi:hypothetical protein